MVRRVLDLTEGVAMIVADLHGDWDAYTRYRDRFFHLREEGATDRLVFCGDLIHSEGPADADRSLDIVLDVMQLQATCDPDAIVMLLGNHELPHIYGFTLGKGHVDYTPRFEAALTAAGAEARAQVTAFFEGLPFFLRTAAGVMITHAGAAMVTAIPGGMMRLVEFDHAALRACADARLAGYDREGLRQAYGRLTGVDYDEQARRYLAVTGPTDPRYDDLLRTMLLNRDDADFDLLWETFYTRNELAVGEEAYQTVLRRFLQTWSDQAPAPQGVLVVGHVPVRGGYQIVAGQQLRFASAAHAHPREAGVYLLLDCATPVQAPLDLIPYLGSVFR